MKCDWPKNPDWTNEFYHWLKNASKKPHVTEMEVSQMLGYDFRFLADDAFEYLNLNVRSL